MTKDVVTEASGTDGVARPTGSPSSRRYVARAEADYLVGDIKTVLRLAMQAADAPRRNINNPDVRPVPPAVRRRCVGAVVALAQEAVADSYALWPDDKGDRSSQENVQQWMAGVYDVMGIIPAAPPGVLATQLRSCRPEVSQDWLEDGDPWWPHRMLAEHDVESGGELRFADLRRWLEECEIESGGFRGPASPDMADCLRRAFGNPFRPIRPRGAMTVREPGGGLSGLYAADVFYGAFSEDDGPPASWLTDDVVRLAAALYAEPTAATACVLADALEDAGCDCDQVLMPLRGARPAVAFGCDCGGTGVPEAMPETRCVCDGRNAWVGPKTLPFRGMYALEVLREAIRVRDAARATADAASDADSDANAALTVPSSHRYRGI